MRGLDPFVAYEFQCPGSHPIIRNPVKGPESKPPCKTSDSLLFVGLEKNGPEKANNFIDRNVWNGSSKRA
jgi:hypothetical protein